MQLIAFSGKHMVEISAKTWNVMLLFETNLRTTITTNDGL